MADKIIAARLQIDSGNSNQAIKETNKNLTEVKGNLSETGAATKETTGHFGNLKDKLSSMPGPLGSASEGVKGLGTAFKALLANPVALAIAAIVAALAFLYKAFTNTFEGANKVEQVFAGLKASVQAILDKILGLGSAVIKLFSGDFKGAAADAKAAVTGIGDAAKAAYDKVSLLTKQAQELSREQAQNDLESAERAKKLALLREQAEDPEVSTKKRKEALLELRKDAEQNSKDDIDLARRTAENQIALLSQGTDAAKKNEIEIKKIKADQINVETQNANELRRIGKQITSIDREEQTNRTQAAKEAAEARKKIQQEQHQREKEQLQEEAKASEELRKLKRDRLLAEVKDENEAAKQTIRIQLQSEIERIEALKVSEDSKIALRVELRKKAYEQLQNLEDKIAEDTATAEEKRQERLQQRLNGAKGIKVDQQDPEKRAEEIIRLTEGESALKLALLDSEYQKRLELVKGNEEAELNLKKWYAGEKRSIDQAEADFKLQMVDAIGGGIGALGSLLSKGSAAAKIAALTEIAIGTGTGFIRALEIAQKSAAATGPGAAFAFPIFYATQLIAVLGAVSKAKAALASSPGGGGGGGSVSAPSISPSAPITPTVGTTALDQGSLNQIGNATTRAYIVDYDAQSNQERNTRLNRAARLGG